MATKKSAKKKPVKAEKKTVQRPKLKLTKSASRKAKASPRVARGAAGHNSGVNTPLVTLFDEYERLDANKKEITKAQSDIRARAKDEHGVAKKNFTHEIALRKLDAAVRVEFEQGQKDLQDMLGYQFSLEILQQQGGEGESDDSAQVGDHDVEGQNAEAASSELH